MTRIGICGSGFMAKMHAICYGHMADVQVVAVASKDEASGREMCAKYDAVMYADAGDLIREADVDVVNICLPTHLHARYAIQAAERGRAIFCEKPLARTLEQADSVVAAVRKAGVPMMVGHCLRFWPEYVALKEFHDKGELGPIRALSLSRYQGKITFGWQDWFNNPEFSGCSFLDFHIHDVDTLRWILGDPKSVQSVGHYRWNCSIYDYPGVVATSESGWSSADPFDMRFRAVFEDGVLLYSSRNQPLTLFRKGREPELVPLDVEKDEDTDAGGNISNIRAYYNQLRYFIDAQNGNVPLDITALEEARNSLALVLTEMAEAAKRWDGPEHLPAGD
jgi:predicted dehydrogenase